MFANPIFQKMGGFESACFLRKFIHCTRQGLSPVCCCFLPDTFLLLPVQLGRQKHNNVYTKNMKSEKAFVGWAFGKGLGMVSHSLWTVVGQNVDPFFCALTSSHVWATFVNYCKTIIWLFDVWNVRPNVTADILLELKSTERLDFPYLKWMEKTTRSVNPKGDNNKARG